MGIEYRQGSSPLTRPAARRQSNGILIVVSISLEYIDNSSFLLTLQENQ